MTGNLIIAFVYMAGGAVLFLLGTVILRENPRERLNRVTSTMMFFGGLGPVLGFIGTLLYYLQPSGAVWKSGFFYNFFYLWEFFFPQLVLFSLIYPSEHKMIRRFPRIWILIFLPHLFHLLVVLTFSSPDKILSLFDPGRSADQLGPFIEALLVLLKTLSLMLVGIYHVHTKFFSTVNLFYIIAAIVLMSRGYRALQDPLQRKQAQTMIWGLRGSMGIYALGILIPVIAPLNIPLLLRSTFAIIALLVGAGSIAWSIVRHQFLGLRSIVRQSIVYSTASGLILAAYLIVIRQLDHLVTQALGIRVPYLDIAFVIIAVIFFQPLLSRLEEYSERIFRRDRSDYRNVLQRLTRDIISIFEVEQLHQRIASTLRIAGLTDHVELLVRENTSGPLLAVGAADTQTSGIGFADDSRAVRLMANLRGPTTRKEIEVFLEEEDKKKLMALKAHLLVPISHGESLLGVLFLGQKMGGRRYNFEDIAMLSVLAGQMAIALVNARLYQETLEKRRFEEDLKRARQIQESLLPINCPAGDGFLISALSRPSRLVGGDYHDFVTSRVGRLGIAIGDVSGKGMPAALLMAMLQASFNAQVQNQLSVRETVSRVNNHMARFTGSDQFATFFYGELDLKTRSFTYSNAGHNHPFIIRADGDVAELATGGLILGFMSDVPYEEASVSLDPGDTLFLYTDGVTEAHNDRDEEYGEERLVKLLQELRQLSPDQMLESVFREANLFAAGDLLQQDDATMVALQLEPLLGS